MTNADEPPDAWDRVLGAVGLTRQNCHFDFTDMANYGGHELLLPFVDAMHREPLRIPFYARVVKQDFTKAAPSVGELAQFAAWRMDEGTRRTLIGNPIDGFEKASTAPDALLNAIRKVHQAGSAPLSAKQLSSLTAATKTVPRDVAQGAALLILAEVEAYKWRQRSLAKWRAAHGTDLKTLFTKIAGRDEDEEWNDDVAVLMQDIDLKYLMVGGIDLCIAVDKAVEVLGKRKSTESFAFEWQTPLGHIALNGKQNDVYTRMPYLLLIDTGGDDRYAAGGASADAVHPISVLLDISGNDRYVEQREFAATPVATFAGRKTTQSAPSFGAGVLGYGLLVDLQGDDLYRSLSHTQGRGAFGLGILQDRTGNDRYDCYTDGQGSAYFGVGVLADLEGTDEYRCFTTSQGFAYTKGCGVLVDAGESNDLYEANDTVIDFPSPQDKNHNASLAQGAGFGRRADYSDGHSQAGGVGVLVDAGGKNSFSCGVYGQGTGYWYGTGILCAGGGDDTYRGIWYVQGAIAHFATAVLWDEGGNDNYIATHNMAQGAGHDFGTGFLIDDAGNDRHEAPNLSLGGGNANGFGFFWDKAGDDTYIVGPSTTLGRASTEQRALSIRDRNLTLGIFLDTGGRDTYPEKIPSAHNDALWSMEQSTPSNPMLRGAGLDTDSSATLQ